MFAVLLIVAVLLPLLGGVGVAEVAAARAGVRVAADAAALAGAQQAIVTEQTDATGTVYSYSVQINAATAPTAARDAWNANSALFMGGSTTSFHVSIDNNPAPGAPATIDIVGSVTFPDTPLALVGAGKTDTVTVQAIAGTCGYTAWPGSGAWCQQ